MKTCTKCKQNKELSDFGKAKFGKDGVRSICRSCKALQDAEYQSKHQQEIATYGKQYREEKAEQISAQRATHTIKNKEKLAEYQTRWRLANPGKSNARTARRRASRRKAMPKWLTKEHHLEMIAKYDEAVKLTKETGIPHEVDHIIPLQGKTVRGLHVPWNLQIITRHENRKKSRKVLK